MFSLFDGTEVSQAVLLPAVAACCGRSRLWPSGRCCVRNHTRPPTPPRVRPTSGDAQALFDRAAFPFLHEAPLGSDVFPIFVNEAAYYEKGIAFALCLRDSRTVVGSLLPERTERPGGTTETAGARMRPKSRL